jgi:Tol biopolymer transport system component
MNIDGSDQRQLTNGGIEFLPVCTPDGKWIIYTSLAEKPTLSRVSIDGGESKQMSETWARSQAVSPDGKMIAFGGWSELGPSHIALAVSPTESASESRTFDIPLTFRLDTINWTADGRSLIYIDTRNGISNLWKQPLVGGQPVQLTSFKSDQIFNFNLSSDGKQLAFSRGTVVSDVVLIRL